jgi:hypothetical protein
MLLLRDGGSFTVWTCHVLFFEDDFCDDYQNGRIYIAICLLQDFLHLGDGTADVYYLAEIVVLIFFPELAIVACLGEKLF